MRHIHSNIFVIVLFMTFIVGCSTPSNTTPLAGREYTPTFTPTLQDDNTDVNQQEQALFVYLPWSNDSFGTTEEIQAIFMLEDELASAISAANVGEFDGNEFGEGQCTLYMYGPDADRLFTTVQPILKHSKLAENATVVKRYGEPGAAEVMIKLGQ